VSTTGTQVVTRARAQASDATATVRVSNATLATYITDGVRDIVDRHPEAQMGSSIVITAPVEIEEGDLGTDLVITDNWVAALVDYVLFRVFGEDSQDISNAALSKDHFNLYLAAV